MPAGELTAPEQPGNSWDLLVPALLRMDPQQLGGSLIDFSSPETCSVFISSVQEFSDKGSLIFQNTQTKALGIISC